jgi:hypothetical protein
MVIFHGYVTNNQIVVLRFLDSRPSLPSPILPALATAWPSAVGPGSHADVAIAGSQVGGRRSLHSGLA